MSSKRFPRAQFVLPAVIDPPRICTTVQVPNDPQHIAAFLGALYDLTMSATWARDPDHKAALVSRVWTDVFDHIVMGNCAQTIGDDVQFRQKDCLLQFSVDCVNWITLYDPTDCIRGITGSPQPPGSLAPGECQEFDVELSGSEEWLCPIPINDGYTIEVSAAEGAWNDGGAPNWFCPDGTPYILGQCVGSRGHVGGDPSGSAYHMAIIAVIETATPIYIDILAGQYTVPTATGPNQLHFQANDSDITNNNGAVRFHLKICNATAVTWMHTFDFTIDDRGWIGRPTYSSYAAGVGWEDTNYNLYVQMPTLAAALDITYFRAEFTVVTPDTQTGGVIIDDRTSSWSQVVELLRNDALFQTGGILEWTGAQTIAAGDGADFGWSAAGATSAHVRLTKVILAGTGTDPF